METTDEPILAAELNGITDPKKKLYLQALAATGCYGPAAKAAGVCAVTGYNWRQDMKDSAFQAGLVLALKLGVEGWEGEMARRGFRGVEKPVYQGGKLVGTVRDYDTTAGIFMLKGALPEKYRDRFEHSGPQGGPIQVDTHAFLDVPSAQLAERFDALRAMLEAARQALPQPDTIEQAGTGQTDQAAEYAKVIAGRNGGGSDNGDGH